MIEHGCPVPDDELWNPILDEFEYWFEKAEVASVGLDVIGPGEVAVVFHLSCGMAESFYIGSGGAQELWEHATEVLAEHTSLPPLEALTTKEIAVLEPARIEAEKECRRSIEKRRRFDYRRDLIRAQAEADRLFRLQKYSRVVEVLAPYERDLGKVHNKKLCYARKKSE